MFKALFCDIQQFGKALYQFRRDLVDRRDKMITEIFENIERGRTSDLKLPDHFLSLLESNQSKRGRDQGGGGGGGGGHDTDKQRKIKGERNDQHKQLRDHWSAPESDEDPVATYFSEGKGKACKDQWMAIKFKHHRKKVGSDTFAETPLCLPFQVANYCAKGKQCELNHRIRKNMILDTKMKNKVLQIDKIVDSTSL